MKSFSRFAFFVAISLALFDIWVLAAPAPTPTTSDESSDNSQRAKASEFDPTLFPDVILPRVPIPIIGGPRQGLRQSMSFQTTAVGEPVILLSGIVESASEHPELAHLGERADEVHVLRPQDWFVGVDSSDLQTYRKKEFLFRMRDLKHSDSEAVGLTGSGLLEREDERQHLRHHHHKEFPRDDANTSNATKHDKKKKKDAALEGIETVAHAVDSGVKATLGGFLGFGF